MNHWRGAGIARAIWSQAKVGRFACLEIKSSCARRRRLQTCPFSRNSRHRQAVGFFEVHAENYMGAGGPSHAQLTALRERYALSVHGVGLSIGSMQPLDRAHLARLKILCDRYEPESFSEHLAWSSHDGIYFNDLLPLPYTEETLARVAQHIDEVQTALKRTMLLENPSTYVGIAESTIPEVEFLAEIAHRTGCGLLLDVNNVFVSASNQGLSALSIWTRFRSTGSGKFISAVIMKKPTRPLRRSSSMRMVRRSRTRSGRSVRKSSPAPDRCRP